MKKVSTIARILLGVIFVVFAANFWLKFIPVPGPPEGVAANFMGGLYGSGYLMLIKVLELVFGALLIVGRFTNLALMVIGAIVFNIAAYHFLMVKGGYPMAIALIILSVLALLGQKPLLKTLSTSA